MAVILEGDKSNDAKCMREREGERLKIMKREYNSEQVIKYQDGVDVFYAEMLHLKEHKQMLKRKRKSEINLK